MQQLLAGALQTDRESISVDSNFDLENGQVSVWIQWLTQWQKPVVQGRSQ